MTVRGGRLLATVLALLLAAAPAVTAAAGTPTAASSLPAVTSGARPGPDVLYSAPPPAPQLENRDARFRADPLLVMGQEAYVDGEYLYQDWLYDDNGGDSGAMDSGGAQTGGDFDYPTDRGRYGGNAADLVEVRIAPGPSSVAYRFTLNTLLVADSTIVTLAFDTDATAATGKRAVPRDPGFSFPGTDEAITTWGTGAEHSKVPTVGSPVTTPVDVDVDLEANQITVTVPKSLSDPTGTWKATVAAGLFDPATGGWLRPGPTATATSPGGAGPLDPQPSGVFNLGFRLDEAPAGMILPDAKQSVAIRQKAPGAFQRDIDFAALARRESRTTVKATGAFGRIFASRINFGEGKDYTATPELLGQLQPYSIYLPTTYQAGKPAGLTLNLHSLDQHHWQYIGSRGMQQIGEGRGSIVITSESRGASGSYQKEAEYDVFEMWNDVARHYSLDSNRVAIAGYSMGGYGAYRLATLYPDLFGKAFTIAGPPAAQRWAPPAPFSGDWGAHTNVLLENARNVPFLNAAAALDALVPITGARAQNTGAPELGIRGFEQLGYRYRFAVYPTADHFSFGILSYDLPYAAQFLGDSAVDRDPYHVTFSYAPAADDRSLGLVHDHAYWVSDIRLADPKVGTPIPKATVDAFSHAAGKGDPASSPRSATGVAPLPYVESGLEWQEPPPAPVENRLNVNLTNVGHVVLDVGRAGLDAGQPITVALSSSAKSTLVLAGDFSGKTTVTSDGQPLTVTLERGRLAIPVEPGTRTLVIAAQPVAASEDLRSPPDAELPATGGSMGITGAALLTLGVAGFYGTRRLRPYVAQRPS